MEPPRRDEFDLFVSYAHADNRGEHAGKVSTLCPWAWSRHFSSP